MVAKPADAEKDATLRAHFNDDMRTRAPSTFRKKTWVAFIYSLILGGRLCVGEALKCASSVAFNLSRCGSLHWAYACSLMWHERVAFIYSIGGCRFGLLPVIYGVSAIASTRARILTARRTTRTNSRVWRFSGSDARVASRRMPTNFFGTIFPP